VEIDIRGIADELGGLAVPAGVERYKVVFVGFLDTRRHGVDDLAVLFLDRAVAAEHPDDVFTAGVCLTAALTWLHAIEQSKRAILKTEREYPIMAELFAWASQAAPEFESEEGRNAYIQKMVTPGGVTEAIMQSLYRGETLDAAVKAGIARTHTLSMALLQSISAQAY
jgi:hypothetical protein